MSDDHPSGDWLADQLLPLDGPYEPGAIIVAAATIAELVRRLNHATIARRAFRYPSEVDRTLGGLKAAAYGLPQLFTQLAEQLDVFRGDTRLYSDRTEDSGALFMAGANALVSLDEAGVRAGWMAAKLDDVTRHTHTLGLREHHDTEAARKRNDVERTRTDQHAN